MHILKQCQIWHKKGEYEKIIDALEGIPVQVHTAEIDMELARAYNNQAVFAADAVEKDMLRRSISLLKTHEETCKEDHLWNYRLGYAYFYCDQEPLALGYFEKALELLPDDADTLEFIQRCKNALALPRFEKNFRERVQEAWTTFAEIEGELRRIMDADKTHEQGDALMAKCGEALEIALSDPAFELGFNGEKYELILSPNGNKARLFPLIYFKTHAPAVVLNHWNVLVGRQPSQGFGLRAGDWDVSAEDVQVWVEKSKDSAVSLTFYCKKLLPLLREEEGRVWWMLSILTDQVLGEVAAIALIDGFDVVDTPKAEPAILLSALPETIEKLGLSLSNDAEHYLENSYLGYQLEPVEDPEADWRLDVFGGSTRLPHLINDYLSNTPNAVDAYYQDGIAAGFFCYPLDGFPQEDRGNAILDFRDALEAAVLETAGADAVTFVGGASGIYTGYLDFVAWDLPAVLQAAKQFFAASDLPWANFHVFRRNVPTVRLWNREDDAE